MSQNTSTSNESSQANQGLTANGGSADLTGGVKKLAGEAAGQTKKIAEAKFTGQKDRAVEALGSVAQALRTSGEQLKSQNASGATQYVARAADGVDRLSSYLQSRNLGDLIEDAERFARREPAVFLGGAFVAGLIGSRFLKSSRRSESSGGVSSGNAPGQGPRAQKPGQWDPYSSRTHRAGGRAYGYNENAGDDTRPTLPTGTASGSPTPSKPIDDKGATAGTPGASSRIASPSGSSSSGAGSSMRSGTAAKPTTSASGSSSAGTAPKTQDKPQDRHEKT